MTTTDSGTDSVPIPRSVIRDATLSDRAYKIYSVLRDYAWTLRHAACAGTALCKDGAPALPGELSIRGAELDDLLVLVGCGQSQFYLHLGALRARNYLDYSSAGRVMTVVFPEPEIVTVAHVPSHAETWDQPSAIPENPEPDAADGGGGLQSQDNQDREYHHHHVRVSRNGSGFSGTARAAPASGDSPRDPGRGDHVPLTDAASEAVFKLLVGSPVAAGCEPVWRGAAKRLVNRNGARNVLAWYMWYHLPKHREGLTATAVHALVTMLNRCEAPPDTYVPPLVCSTCGRIEACCACAAPVLMVPVELYIAAARSQPHEIAPTNPWGICARCHGLYAHSCTCGGDDEDVVPGASDNAAAAADLREPVLEAADCAGVPDEHRQWIVQELAQAQPEGMGGTAGPAQSGVGGAAVCEVSPAAAAIAYLAPVRQVPVDAGQAARADEIWTLALGQLQMQMTRATFDTWVKGSQGLGYEDDVFVVGVASGYAREWLEHRLHATIRRTLANVLGRQVEVLYVISRHASAPARDPLRYHIAQRVQHPLYGEGVVLGGTVTGRGTQEIMVQFEGGCRRFETTGGV